MSHGVIRRALARASTIPVLTAKQLRNTSFKVLLASIKATNEATRASLKRGKRSTSRAWTGTNLFFSAFRRMWFKREKQQKASRRTRKGPNDE